MALLDLVQGQGQDEDQQNPQQRKPLKDLVQQNQDDAYTNLMQIVGGNQAEEPHPQATAETELKPQEESTYKPENYPMADPHQGHIMDLESRERQVGQTGHPKLMRLAQLMSLAAPVAETAALPFIHEPGAAAGAARGINAGATTADQAIQQRNQDVQGRKQHLLDLIEQERRQQETEQTQERGQNLRERMAEESAYSREELAQKQENARALNTANIIAGQNRRADQANDTRKELEASKEKERDKIEASVEQNRKDLQKMRDDTAMAQTRMRVAQAQGKVNPALVKNYQDYQNSISRYDIMLQNQKAAAGGDQQAMLSLLTNHIGMTLGSQKGGRITQQVLEEAQASAPWLQRVQARFGADGLLSGVTLTPEQVQQMVDLAKNKVTEDNRNFKAMDEFLNERMFGGNGAPGGGGGGGGNNPQRNNSGGANVVSGKMVGREKVTNRPLYWTGTQFVYGDTGEPVQATPGQPQAQAGGR